MEQVHLFNEYHKAASYARELHYDRNKYNKKAPDDINDIDENNWEKLSLGRSWYHQNTSEFFEFNIKFISKDWHSEVIYNSDWDIVNDIKDIWTYNFFHPVLEDDKHFKYDILPYYEWWNWINDDTNIINRYLWF